MGKYDPLAAFLSRQRDPEVVLSFRDIERIVGRILPKAAHHPDWWTGRNGGVAAPQRRAWDSANFTPSVDMKAETVRFRRGG